jgi:hypothetical protein
MYLLWSLFDNDGVNMYDCRVYELISERVYMCVRDAEFLFF